MANEAVWIETPTKIKRYTVIDATAIPYGTLLELSGGSVNSARASQNSTGAGFAGIAIEEKTASDGITEIGAAIDGAADLTVGGVAVTIGTIVCLSGANTIRACAAGDLLTGAAFGKVLEAGVANGTHRIRLGLV